MRVLVSKRATPSSPAALRVPNMVCRHWTAVRSARSAALLVRSPPGSCRNVRGNFAINWARVSGAPRVCGSPRKRCQRRKRRAFKASEFRQKGVAAGVVARSRALCRLRVKCDRQHCRCAAG